MSKRSTYHILHKKLTNQLSKKESDQIEAMSPQEGEILKDVDMIWNMSAYYAPPVSFNSDTAFNSLMNRINEETVDSEPTKAETVAPEAKIVRLFAFKTLARLAAVFVFGLAAYSTFNSVVYDSYHSSETNSYATLEDGSSVWLAPGSSLTYSSMFGNTRKVVLKGKAFFDVARDESKPFVISSDDLEVSVLGTSFTVDSQARTINVNSGKVKVAAPTGEVTLSKGQSVDASLEQLTVDTTTEVNLSWINPSLKFDNTPLDQVIKELSIHFNVDLIYKGRTDLSTCPFTATDLSNTSLDQVLTILRATYSLEIKKEFNENVELIYLSRVRCR